MSYNDDEELKIGDTQEEDDDFDFDSGAIDPADADLVEEDDAESIDGFAGLDGSLY